METETIATLPVSAAVLSRLETRRLATGQDTFTAALSLVLDLADAYEAEHAHDADSGAGDENQAGTE